MELLPDLDVLLKIEIPEGATNPIVLRFKRTDMNGDAVEGGVAGVSFYGSFTSRSPTITNSEYNLRNVSKVLIKEPSKENAKEFLDTRNFYMKMQSGNRETIHIRIASFVKVKVEPKKLNPNKRNGDGDDDPKGEAMSATVTKENAFRQGFFSEGGQTTEQSRALKTDYKVQMREWIKEAIEDLGQGE